MEITTKKNRVLSVFTLVMINVIAIDSVRNLPANAKIGLALPFFYIIASILFLLPCILLTAELATHRPKTGGVYIWVRDAFGPRWGFVNIWLQWIYNVFWYPTILSFIAVNIAYLINPALANNKMFMIPVIIGMFSIATLGNFFGMRLSGFLSTLSAIAGTILPMLCIIGLGIGWVIAGKPFAIAPTLNNFLPSFSHMHNVAFLVIVFFSLMGIEMSAVHAESVKNPQRDFPRALVYSSILIVLTAVLASTTIAIIVPASKLNIISGLDQAFNTFLATFHLQWLLPILIVLMILGAFGGISAWVIGPSKGLMVAAEDGSLPKILSYRSKNDVPVSILIAQFIMVSLLCCAFALFKSMSTWYWILSDLTAQLALLFYIIFFAAAICLRYKTPKKKDAYRIPGGNWGIWIVGCVGIGSCILAMAVGFIPPQDIPIGNVSIYEATLALGIVVFTLPPLLIYHYKHRNKK